MTFETFDQSDEAILSDQKAKIKTNTNTNINTKTMTNTCPGPWHVFVMARELV